MAACLVFKFPPSLFCFIVSGGLEPSQLSHFWFKVLVFVEPLEAKPQSLLKQSQVVVKFLEINHQSTEVLVPCADKYLFAIAVHIQVTPAQSTFDSVHSSECVLLISRLQAQDAKLAPICSPSTV
jgi:hypothetical protein